MSNETNSLELVSVIFGAGDSKLLMVSGNYFELIDCPLPVDVVLSDSSGAQRVRMKQAEASFYSKDVSFSVVQITSATAQTIRFAYGTGEAGTRRSTGSVVISGAVALDAATLLALEQTNVRPEIASAKYAALTAMSANVAEQIFAPGANTNGALILSAGAHAYATGGPPIVSLLSKAGAAPATIIDGEVYASTLATSGNSANHHGSFNLPKIEYVPAGHGLYFISASVTLGGVFELRHCRYKLL